MFHTNLKNSSLGQYEYGLCLEAGEGIAADTEAAARYYKLVADQQNQLGVNTYGHYQEHTVQNFEEAARYYKLAAEQGCPAAQLNFADSCEKGSSKGLFTYTSI